MKIEYTGPHKPTQSTKGSAGFDLTATDSDNIYPGFSYHFKTGLHIAIPHGYVGIIKSRSGLSFNNSIEHGAGVIDSDYRGEVKIKLYNHGNRPVHIHAGDRIAQLLIIKHESPEFVLVDSLDQTDRGDNGFGSTGAK
jgi:dUTP pyrophosphatase